MNKQEVYDKVRKHLLTQNATSFGAYSITCYYRGIGDLKCALGCLIPDEDYDSELEGLSVRRLLAHPGEASKLLDVLIKNLGHLDKMDLEFLRDLQVIHDQSDVPDWRSKLDQFATEHSLCNQSLNN